MSVQYGPQDPLGGGPLLQESAPRIAPLRPDEAPVNILIVDDESKNLTVLETVLDDPSYRLVRSSSGEAALLALIVDEFALLILDINMPGMSGFELAQMIRKRKKNAYVPIIFLTAYYNEEQHVLEGYGTGAVDYLHKPVSPGILRSKVSVFVDLYRKNRELAAANRSLLVEVDNRRRVEAQLKVLNETLEQRITDRTIALMSSEEQFRQLADSMPQMVWTARPDGGLDYYNARWSEFSGLRPKPGGDNITWDQMLHPADVKVSRQAWYDSLRSGVAYRGEFRFFDKASQGYCWFLGRALPIRDESGGIVRWIGTCTDIDDQKRLEQDLRRANQDLEQFAFAASHDLQEPLRNVAIYTELLRQQPGLHLDEESTGFLEIIEEGSRRTRRLISALLEYTQSGGAETDTPTSVNAEEVFERVLSNLAPAIQGSQAEITVSLHATVSMNEVHLEQLLQNLIGNALKYRKDEEPPRIQVSVAAEENGWRFTVEDNGIGIAPQFHEKIFGVFKRLHAAGGKYAGSGIGLAICRKIVEGYDGRIWVESQLGLGSTFHFTIAANRRG